MNIQKLPMRCGEKRCGREFMGEIVIDAPIDLAVASMKAIRCPKCGSKRKVLLLMGEEAKAAMQRMGETEAVRRVFRLTEEAHDHPKP